MYKVTVHTNPASPVSSAMELLMLQLIRGSLTARAALRHKATLDFPPVTRCIAHAQSTCTNYYCNRQPWALGRGFSLQPQAKGHLHCFLTLGKYQMPQQTM